MSPSAAIRFFAWERSDDARLRDTRRDASQVAWTVRTVGPPRRGALVSGSRVPLSTFALNTFAAASVPKVRESDRPRSLHRTSYFATARPLRLVAVVRLVMLAMGQSFVLSGMRPSSFAARMYRLACASLTWKCAATAL